MPLMVYLNSRLVGRLNRQSSGAIDFQYDDSWLSWKHALPVSLSLPLREDRYIGDPVVAVFENLLPDNEDVISAQPSFDAGEFRRAQMKFAMAVGSKRHYALHTIKPRHFVQTAAMAGIDKGRVDNIFREILQTAPTAIDSTLAMLPLNFALPIADSIIGGIRQRCRVVEEYLSSKA